MRQPAQISTTRATARLRLAPPGAATPRVRRLLMIAGCLFVLSILALPASAQAPVVSATVDRTDLGGGEPLALTITVNGANGRPYLPALADFRILDAGSGTQINTVNGTTTVQAVTQYLLLPLRAGDLLIPSVPVIVDGQTYRTDPIRVTVSEAAASSAPAPSGSSSQPPSFQSGNDPFDLLNMLDRWMQGSPGLGSLSRPGQVPINPAQTYQQIAAPAALQGQDYYAEALIDKPAAYQGEQVLYTLRLYQALDPYGQIQYQPPAFSGFWSKQLPGQQTYVTQAGGRTYRVTEIQQALFPTVAGKVAIDAARLVLPPDFMSAQGVEVASQPLTLDVQPLPAGAPTGFRGAVGQYRMEDSVDKTEAKVGDALTQRVAITGAGNIEQVTDPAWPDDAAWRAFDSKSTTDSQFQDGKLVGVRRIERVLVPTQPGDHTLPAAEFSYFDPSAGQYRTITAQPVTVSVAPDGSAPAGAAQPAASQGAANTTGSLPAARPLKAVSAQSLAAGESLPHQPIYWGLWVLPVALIAGQYVGQRRQRHEQVNAAAQRSRKAAGQADQALRAAAKDPQTAHEAAGRILVDYLSARLQRPVSGLTQSALAEEMLACDVDPGLVVRVQGILTRSELGRYAPAGYSGSTGDLLAETRQVIDDLERQLRSTTRGLS
jgi:BatD DUF11 like domain